MGFAYGYSTPAETYPPSEPVTPWDTGTSIVYNGVSIVNATTREWDESVEYDKSGTDAIGVRFKMRFTGYIHVQSIGAAGHAPTYMKVVAAAVPETMAANYTSIHKRLWEPRKNLSVSVNDDLLLECFPPTPEYRNNKDRDIDNGPKPRGLNLVQVVNDQILKVEFSIECMKMLCEQAPIYDVLNNRWSINESMDSDFYTTRTIRGNLRLSASDYADMNPASFRHIVVPGLERGFKRQTIEYAVSESGLECEYQITDRQVYNSAPWPATDISGSYSSTTADGVTFSTSCHVRLTGSPNSPRRSLIARAVQIVERRLDYYTKLTTGKCWPESASISESIGHDNTVDVAVTIRENPGNIGNFLTALRTENLGTPLQCAELPGQPLPYDRALSPSPALYGYNSLADPTAAREPVFMLLMRCYLQSPCNNAHQIGGATTTGSLVTQVQDDTTSVVAVDSGSLAPQPANNKWGVEHKRVSYTYCRYETKYLMEKCRAQMPIAKIVTEGGPPGEDTCVFIDLAPGITVREATVDVERIGELPQIPSPLDSYTSGTGSVIKGRLLRHHLIALPPVLSADGLTFIYRIRAYYKWGLNRMPRASDDLAIGRIPLVDVPTVGDTVSGSTLYNSNL